MLLQQSWLRLCGEDDEDEEVKDNLVADRVRLQGFAERGPSGVCTVPPLGRLSGRCLGAADV